MNGIIIYSSILVLAYTVLLFIVSRIAKRNDIADVGWGLGFIVVAWSALNYDVFSTGRFDPRGLIIVSLVTLWGLRLFLHIYRRFRSRTEDPRYVAMREKWGRLEYLYSFFEVFMLQGFLLLLIALPVMFGITVHTEVFPQWLDIMGIAVWLVGFLYEAVADRQLATFLRKPENRGHLMQSGLWAYSRHPNYFGEIVLWWGVWLVSLAAGSPLWTVIGPLMITYLITHVSGVPMTEARQESHPEFSEYKKRVSRLVPLYPGKLFIRGKKSV